MEKIRILNSPDLEHPFLVVEKPSGLPSAPLYEGDFSALTLAAEEFPEIKNVRGKKKIEHGLVHRIDTQTTGLVLIALTQSFYDFMLKEQAEDRFEKWYTAQVDFDPEIQEKIAGFPPLPFSAEEIQNAASSRKIIEIKSAFRKFGPGGKEVRPIIENSGKAAWKKAAGGQSKNAQIYKTEVQFLGGKKVLAHITRGFRHQVRCHLAWLGLPVFGDKIYNPAFRTGQDSENQKMKFQASKIKFMNPATCEFQTFEIPQAF